MRGEEKQTKLVNKPLVRLRDDTSPSEVGPLDGEAAVVQLHWQCVLEGDLCSQFPIHLRFTQDLQSTVSMITMGSRTSTFQLIATFCPYCGFSN